MPKYQVGVSCSYSRVNYYEVEAESGDAAAEQIEELIKADEDLFLQQQEPVESSSLHFSDWEVLGTYEVK